MSTDGILLFTNDGGGSGSGSNLYDQTSFADTSLPASNNSGLSSTVGRNPLSDFFANDLAPKWMAKTLWIRDLVRIEDRSLWINSKPTYRVIWNENFPGANGYLFGDIVTTGTGETKSCLLGAIGDGFGVDGVIRRVQWIFKPSNNASTTAQQYLDGSATTTLTVGGLPAADAVFTYPAKSFYSVFVHAATNETHDLHDYRITANQYASLQVQGVVVYYDIAGDGIECFTGTAYLNKSQVSPVGSSLAFPTGASTFLGGVAGIQFAAQGSFGLTSVMVPSTSSIAIGTINTNLLSLSTGTGSSFPIGSAVYVPTGASYYAGVVTNVSSDVITVGPTLPIGLSGAISQIFKIGASFPIGATLYRSSLDYQPVVQNRGMGSSMLPSPDLMINQSSAALNWRVWGFTHQFVYGASIGTGFSTYSNNLSSITLGLIPSGVSSFLQIDGRFQALEAEWMVGLSCSLAASFVVDGLAYSSLSEGASLGPGLYRRTIFTDAGVGWHSVRMNWGGSTQVALSRLRGYNLSLAQSVTLGLLAEIPISQTFITRTSATGSTTLQNGLTSMAWGNVKRIYADSLSHSASWTFLSGKDVAYAPGGVQLASTTASQSVSFQYFGTQYSIIGNPGATIGITVDGGADSAGSTFNTWLGTGLTLGFHTVVITVRDAGATTTIGAIDFLSPVGEVVNNQNFTPFVGFSSLIKSTISPLEPAYPRTGDIWIQDESKSIAFQRAFGGWQRMNISQPACFVGATATQNIASAQIIPAIYDLITSDPFGMASFGTPTLTITIPCDGNYLLGGANDITGVNIGTKSLFVQQVDGTQYRMIALSGASLSSGTISGNVLIPNLKKGMKFVPQIGQANSAGTTMATVGGLDRTYFYCMRMGP